MTDPFLNPGQTYGAVDAQSRIDRVRHFDREQCLSALELDGLQKTVEKALRARLRKLDKAATPDDSPARTV